MTVGNSVSGLAVAVGAVKGVGLGVGVAGSSAVSAAVRSGSGGGNAGGGRFPGYFHGSDGFHRASNLHGLRDRYGDEDFLSYRNLAGHLDGLRDSHGDRHFLRHWHLPGDFHFPDFGLSGTAGNGQRSCAQQDCNHDGFAGEAT